MFGFNRMALFAPDDDGAPGGGAAGGADESQQDEGKQPKDVVPKSQFLAALSSAEQKRERDIAALRAEFEAKLAKATEKPAEAPKRYSRTQLNAAVTAGSITQDQADEAWETQIREDARADATRVAFETVNQAQRKETVDSQIAQYKALMPEILDNGSETRQKIKDEFAFLIGLGDPNNVATELKAIRAVCGPIDKVSKARQGKTSHESHQETSGGGEGGAGPRGGEGKLKLSARERDYYEQGIKSGRYKDWKAVEDELKFARPEVRRKFGAPV